MANAERPPVTVTLTCLAARYEVPAVDSLGERLMQQPAGGAVAVLGPSGLSQNAPATELGEAFYRAILHDGVGELGMAFLRARRSLPVSLFTKDTIAVYNLLGDPALRIAGNDPQDQARLPAQVLLEGLARTYDGAPQAAVVATDPPGLAVRTTYDGSPVPPVAAGTYAVSATVATADYEGSAVGTLVISKAPAGVQIGGLAQVFDGSSKAIAVDTVPAGLPVSITYDGEPLPPVAAGSYPVEAKIEDPNYEGEAADMLVVAKAAATVSLGALAQSFDGLPKMVSVSTEPAGLAVAVTYNGRSMPPAAAGKYAVVVTIEEANHAGTATGTLVVSKANAAVLLHNLEQVYDGTPRHAMADTQPDELAVDFTYDGSVRAPVAVGTYAVAGRISDANWQGTASGTLVVGKASQSILFGGFPDPGVEDIIRLEAEASSGLPVAFEVRSGLAVISGGNLLSFTGPGPVIVAAVQPGDANWLAAPDVLRTFMVSPVLISASRVNVRENGEGRFFVRLAAPPAAATTVTVSRAEGAETLFVQAGSTLVFTPSNWNTWQPVVLSAAADADEDDEDALFRIAVPGSGDQFIRAVALDADVGENLALAARGSRVSGGARGGQMIDGLHTANTNYAYVTTAPPGAMTLDLRAATAVAQIRILNWNWSHRTHRYRIESSVDGLNWALLVDAGAEDRQGWDDWTFATVPTRYLRLTALSNSANALMCIAEWEVYGPREEPRLPQPVLSKTNVNVRENGEGRFFVKLDREPSAPVTVAVEHAGGDGDVSVTAGATLAFHAGNWDAWQSVTLAAAGDADALDGTATIRVAMPGAPDQFVTARELDGDIGENLALPTGGSRITGLGRSAQLVDGIHTAIVNYGYMDSAAVPPGSMMLDLRVPTVVTRMRLLNWDWTHRVHRYVVESSLDGIEWTLRVDASKAGHQGWDDWPVNATARYLRFTALSNSANSLVCIAEWEVYGRRPRPVVSTDRILARENGEGRFFVRLEHAPAAATTVTVSRTSGDASLSVQGAGTLVFTPVNWSAWQPVTISAADDGDADDGEATFRVLLPGLPAQTVTVRELDDDIGENLALASRGSRVTGGARGGQMIDGTHADRTNYGYMDFSTDPPGSMVLDLRSSQAISRVRIMNWNWTHRVHRYTIESSVDGAAWTMLVDASEADRQGWDDWAVDGVARYLRFTGLSNSANAMVCIPEWEVYGARAPARRSAALPAPHAGNDILDLGPLGPVPVTVVTSDDGPDHAEGWPAVDGDADTAWHGQPGAGGWYIALGYDSPVAMTNLLVDLAEGSSSNFFCLFSLDGEDWQEWPSGVSADPVEFNYLWLLFPNEDGLSPEPRVMEIVPQE
jgi:hypothetical protein